MLWLALSVAEAFLLEEAEALAREGDIGLRLQAMQLAEAYVQRQYANANPFAQMFGQEGAAQLMKQQEERNAARQEE